jgi:hypothetical protein
LKFFLNTHRVSELVFDDLYHQWFGMDLIVFCFNLITVNFVGIRYAFGLFASDLNYILQFVFFLETVWKPLRFRSVWWTVRAMFPKYIIWEEVGKKSLRFILLAIGLNYMPKICILFMNVVLFKNSPKIASLTFCSLTARNARSKLYHFKNTYYIIFSYVTKMIHGLRLAQHIFNC